MIHSVEDFNGKPVHIIINNKAGTILLSAEDAMKNFGFNGTVPEFLATDQGLDFLLEIRRHYPGSLFDSLVEFRRLTS